MRSAALFAATLSCAVVACLGVALLVFLFVARTFAPASAHLVRPLYFDYSEAEATASVSLLASQRATIYAHTLHEVNHKNISVPHSKERFLAPGEQITLWVELELPDAIQHDIFQAVGELRTVDGRTAAKSSRPVLPKPRSAITKLARSVATAPLAAVGLWQDYMKMQVTLFERFREQEDRPFAVFVCRLRGRASKALPPPVASAAVHIRLHLGPLRRMLYWMRPGFWATLWLALVGIAATLGGSGLAVVFAALWLYSISSGGSERPSRPDAAPPDEDALSSDSSANGFSGELSPDSEEESPLAGSPQEADEFEETAADLDFSLLSPRDAAAKRLSSPRRRSSSSIDITPAASMQASPSRGIGGLWDLSSLQRRR